MPASNDVAKQTILPENLCYNPVSLCIELGKNTVSFAKVLAAANPDTKAQNPPNFEQSARVFQDFLDKNIYIQTPQPAFYIYQTAYHDTTQTGIIGCVHTAEYTQNSIKKHENTRPERRQHLTGFLGGLGINTTPVMLSYIKNRTIDQITFEATQAPPTFDITHQTGLSVRLWVVDSPAVIAQITQAFAQINNLYIADGHHRAAVFEDMNAPQFSVLLIPHNQLLVYPFYRLIKKYDNLDMTVSLQKIAENYTIKPCNLSQMYHQYLPKNNFLMCTAQETYQLIPKKHLKNSKNLLDSLDVSILQNTVLAPAFGIADPATDARISFGTRNIALPDFKHLLNKPDTACIFLCKAPDVETIFEIANQNATMPPKSTSFEPKVLSGLVLQKL
jgi:uncharacterized protein (DUF1015 family)